MLRPQTGTRSDKESKYGHVSGYLGDLNAQTGAVSRYVATPTRSGGELSSESAEMRVLRTVPDAFMVSLAHCHRKRGSSRAERAHVKSATESRRMGAGPRWVGAGPPRREKSRSAEVGLILAQFNVIQENVVLSFVEK